MKLRFLILLLPILAASLSSLPGCDNSFSPKSEYEPRLVVFAVLERGKPTQMVRIESTYDAEITNPNQPKDRRDIDAAQVYIVHERIPYYFRDTLLTTTSIVDGQPRVVTKKVWIASSFIPLAAQEYELHVKVAGYPEVTAVTTTPNRPNISMVVRSYESGARNLQVAAASGSVSPQTKGYYFQLWVTAKRLVNNVVETMRFPVLYSIDPSQQSEKDRVTRSDQAEFSVSMVQLAYQNLLPYQDAYDIQVVAKTFTLDINMYNYFKTVRGFDDPVTVRQDRPDVTNLRNGYGVFGGVLADSVSMSYKSLIGS